MPSWGSPVGSSGAPCGEGWRGLPPASMLGAAVATGAAYGLLPVYYRNVDLESRDLTYPLLTHGGIWAAVGAAAGLALGLGLGGRGRWRGAMGGLLGGIAATMVYEPIGALAFPLDKTSEPVSATVLPRLFAHLAVGVLVAAGAALGARGDIPPSAARPLIRVRAATGSCAEEKSPSPASPREAGRRGLHFTGRRQ